ncbi:MAG TPA: bifunctional diaminohydroxyphosphoribosylaminopyrimidine deaminase/5-amino-6-(5-phosphoribosylamino)uracil reductase RibD [Prolixibacteraceae bacterium]|nr:bifunctional diaminohydroxyphosphoribosylaminopyrimidine deaminase/5-amino-6-(5-phosphoribosylamino)uracil reductase RibD [Prolixibacteraceae bacterium]
MVTSEKYMQRCLQLARLGEGRVAPNPMVGSVIVHNGKIIGEGFHQKYGGPHAEVNAINAVKDQLLLKSSTLYVNLEPCAHYGKTPPCSDLIVEKGISKVVIGTVDPFAEVAGKGIEKLKMGGVNVELGILNQECLELNRRFFTFHKEKRPFIILKWAQTADGFVDIDRQHEGFGQPTWITNEMARIAVHKQRASENAILIGTETALKDNPSLTLRDWFGQQPLRIVTDSKLRLPKHYQLFDGKASTYVLSSQNYMDHRAAELIQSTNGADTLLSLLNFLYQKQVLSLIVEGGPRMLQSFIDRNLWDEAHVYTGQICFETGIKAPVFNYSPRLFDHFYNSELRIFRNEQAF